MQNTQQSHPSGSGMDYFFQGFKLIQRKGLRRFVLIPLLVNLILFSVAFYFLYLELEILIAKLMAYIPEFLSFLEVIIWPFAVLVILMTFSFIFSAAANWIAAPFNGLLSEKVEAMLSDKPTPDAGIPELIKDIPRTLGREWSKLVYYIPRAIGFFLLSWLIPVIGQVIWFAFLAWMMAVQYKDYPFDNHKVPFFEMRRALKEKQGLSYGFGITVVFFSMVPIVNLIVMPVAICGATALWVDHYQKQYR